LTGGGTAVVASFAAVDDPIAATVSGERIPAARGGPDSISGDRLWKGDTAEAKLEFREPLEKPERGKHTDGVGLPEWMRCTPIHRTGAL
jgi:hypothetical protein